jgi:hypothetical protein
MGNSPFAFFTTSLPALLHYTIAWLDGAFSSWVPGSIFLLIKIAHPINALATSEKGKRVAT